MLRPEIIKFETEAQWRIEMARQAASEISELHELLHDLMDDFRDARRGVLLRLQTLTWIVISALGGDSVESERLADELYGEAGWLLAEESEAAAP